VPVLLFPGTNTFNLNTASKNSWTEIVSESKRPLFFVIDGTWTQAKATLRQSPHLQSLPRVSFDTNKLSEYEFKKQPRPNYLSCVEGVHRVIEVMAERGWSTLPKDRKHDQMLEIFRDMIQYQLKCIRQSRV
jgi:DTW domain-containing protein YfiP